VPGGRHAHERARRLLGARARLRREAAAPREQARARDGEGQRRFIREIRLPADEVGKFTVGQTLGAKDVFADNSPVDVEGTSKGKGFQGVLKKHHMKGMRGSHGTHEYFRHGGSIGCRLTPQRVHKGKRMAGQMGNETKTVQNLQLFKVLADESCILVRGAVPGAANDYVVVTMAATRTAYQRKGVGKEEVRSKNPLKASKKAAAGRG
jgi:large subunit ribosomal protein L3